MEKVVRADPLFKILRALDRKVLSGSNNSSTASSNAHHGHGHVTETLAYACFTVPFAVAKLGWPPLEPRGMLSETNGNGNDSEKTKKKSKSKPKGKNVGPADFDALSKFAHPKLRNVLDRYHGLATDAEREAWTALGSVRDAVVTNKGTATRNAPRKKKKNEENNPAEIDDTSATSATAATFATSVGSPLQTWHRVFGAWTKLCGYAARVMQTDYHMSSGSVVTQALATAHVPNLYAAPVVDVLGRRAELSKRGATSGKKKNSKESSIADLSTTLKPAKLRFSDLVFGKHGDESALRAVKNLTSRESGSAKRRLGKMGKSSKTETASHLAVSVLPGELLQFVEIMADARADGEGAPGDDLVETRTRDSTRNGTLDSTRNRTGKQSKKNHRNDDEDDANRYDDASHDDFDPDELL
jgi:hypothetical protein